MITIETKQSTNPDEQSQVTLPPVYFHAYAKIMADLKPIPAPNAPRDHRSWARLTFDDQTKIAMPIGQYVHDMVEKREGRYLCTINIKNDQEGYLSPLCYLRGVMTPEPENEVKNFWSAAGKIMRVDSDNGIIGVGIFPQRQGVQPFEIHAMVSIEQLQSLLTRPAPDGGALAKMVVAQSEQFDSNIQNFVQLSGIVRHGRMIAKEISRVELQMPEQWINWLPKSKPKASRDKIQFVTVAKKVNQ